MMDRSEFLTIKEFAELVGISLSSAYQAVHSGELSTYRLGARKGAIRIARNDVQAYLDHRRVETTRSQPKSPPRALKHLKIARG